MIKIMYFLDYPMDSIGGAQGSTISICEGLDNSTFEPIVVCPTLANPSTKWNVKVIQYKKVKKNKYFELIVLIKIYSKICSIHKPDIIHAQMPLSAIALGIMKRFSSYKNIKFIFTDRGLYSGYGKITKKILKFALMNADKIVCTTNYNLNLWENILHTNNLQVIYNSTSLEFENSLNLNDYFGVNISRKEDFLSIGFAGRMTDLKNWPLAIKIVERLQNETERFYLHLAISAYTQEDQKKLECYISQFKYIVGEDRMFFYKDASQKEMVQFYSKLDIFILTSKFESFGKTAIEAMSCACSVIGTNVGGLTEVIGKEENLFELQNEEKCVNYIIKLMKSKKLLSEDKQKFNDRYKNNFSMNSNILAYTKLYKGLFNNGKI